MSVFGSSTLKRSLWVITTYFNWTHVKSKLLNYQVFSSEMQRLDVNLLTIECALEGHAFELNAGPRMVRVRTDSLMWQKERLLNIALERLPSSCTYVCWIDADLFFVNPGWVAETVSALERYGVVQLFDTVVRQTRHGASGPTEVNHDFSITFARDLVRSRPPFQKGLFRHPGYAWASHKHLIHECRGFFDSAVVGGSDVLMANAWFGECDHITRHVAQGAIWSCYERWAKRATTVMRGNVSHIGGTVIHLWHGEHIHRHYLDRHVALNKLGYDPVSDLTQNRDCCWSWAKDKTDMRTWMKSYFDDRREDG